MNSEILVKTTDNLNGLTKEGFIVELKKRLENKVDKAYLYGSITNNLFNRSSDIDLILIKDTNLDFFKRSEEFFYLRDFNASIEYLVYTPSEFESLISNPSVGFWQSVKHQMQQII